MDGHLVPASSNSKILCSLENFTWTRNAGSLLSTGVTNRAIAAAVILVNSGRPLDPSSRSGGDNETACGTNDLPGDSRVIRLMPGTPPAERYL